MGSALFAPLPGLPPADPSARRWSDAFGWVPVHEARPFEARGFEGVGLFTAIVHAEGRVGFGAFDAATGINLVDDAYPSRPLAVEAARSQLRSHGRAAYDAAVAAVLARREA